MNKVILYVGLAILLGTVTMIAPLALLSPEQTIPDDKNSLTVPEFTVTTSEPTEPNEQDFGESKSLDAGNYSIQSVPPPEPAPIKPVEPTRTPPETDVQPEEPELVVRTADDITDLSPIGLLTVPSFLVALGVFVYLRKRIS
ncbi:MAG: hypothetical protein CW716_08860 [Candidatus Bathyarchaeum sp.]|nr:MAG: hypothetical protein CW716_08860 [Candidatus Bathyarchaeum sp.]